MSLGPDHYYKIVEETRQRVADSSELTSAEKETIKIGGYGHVGDGNLHLNVTCPGYDDQSLQERLEAIIDEFVMDYVRRAKGSVSAEHGVGLQKTGYLGFSKSNDMIDVMRQIKGVLDPHGIMNPYKVLPEIR